MCYLNLLAELGGKRMKAHPGTWEATLVCVHNWHADSMYAGCPPNTWFHTNTSLLAGRLGLQKRILEKEQMIQALQTCLEQPHICTLGHPQG